MNDKILFVINGANTKNGANSTYLQLYDLLKKYFYIDVYIYGKNKLIRYCELLLNARKLPVNHIYKFYDSYKYKHIFIMSSIDEGLENEILNKFISNYVRIISFTIQENLHHVSRLKKFDFIICQNDHQFKYIKTVKELETKKVFVIHPGVHLRHEQEFSLEKLTNKGILTNNDGTTKVVCIGSIQPRKNQLQILIGLKNVIDRVQLTLVGQFVDEEYRIKCLTAAKELPSNIEVEFLGFRRDWLKLLQNADVCIIGSEFEGLSNIIRYSFLLRIPLIMNANLWCPDFFVAGKHYIPLSYPFADHFQCALNVAKQRSTVEPARALFDECFSTEVLERMYVKILS